MSNEILIIEPGRVDKHYWLDLWRYRELFAILAWRDIAVRYKQTVIGVAWALLVPLLTMAIFTLIFSKLAGLPSIGNVPYPLLVLAGMLPWRLFSSIVDDASGSLINNANLLSKVYFPRLIVPASAAMVALVDFLISFLVYCLFMLWYGVAPGWRILLLPAFVLMAALASLGPGLWISALNVKYRDFRYAVPFMLQLGLYISPVGFSSHVVPEEWRLLFSLNPMAGVIDGFRWCLLGTDSPFYWPGFLLSLTVMTLFLVLGLRTFRAVEKSLADIV